MMNSDFGDRSFESTVVFILVAIAHVITQEIELNDAGRAFSIVSGTQ